MGVQASPALWGADLGAELLGLTALPHGSPHGCLPMALSHQWSGVLLACHLLPVVGASADPLQAPVSSCCKLLPLQVLS